MIHASAALRCASLLAAPLLLACGQDEILSIDPGDAPGAAAPTVEVAITPDRAVAWLDSTFTGFTDAVNLPFLRVEEGTPELTSRALLRLTNFPDSVFVLDSTSAVVRYDSARLVLTIDSLNSAIASGGTVLQLRTVTDVWDAGSASWELAVDTPGLASPWTTPGGDFGAVLASAEVLPDADSVIFDLTARTDSLVRSWDDTTVANTGLGLTVADSGRIVISAVRLNYVTVPAIAPDTTLSATKLDAAATFLFDPPPPPPPAGILRLGGLQSGRAYLEVVLPDSVLVATPEGDRTLALRGSTINVAELLLISRARPPDPFGAERSFSVGAIVLGDDFRRFGAKTPVGDGITGSLATVSPDSLAAGDTLRVRLTSFAQDWASEPPGSGVRALRFGIRASPEAASFGFWQFGSARGEPAFVPSLRLVFTPGTEFDIP